MTVYHFIDAIPAAFFGLLGIWAAVVRRHWFLRFVVVCLFLLVLLLIPAFEIVIDFGIAIALIMLGVWFARGGQRERLRFSLESALLAMVVVAVASAVVAKAPEFGWADWLRRVSVGGAITIVSLLCLWLVFGQASLRRKLPMSLVGLFVFIAIFYFFSVTDYLLLNPEWSYAWLERLWLRAINPNTLSWGLSHCIPTCLLGSTTICFVLLLARGSGWFTVASDDQPPPSKSVHFARVGLVTLMLSIFLPLCYVFYRLITPTPYPVAELLDDNGFDDLLAFAESNGVNYSAILTPIRSGTKVEAQLALKKIQPDLTIIDHALQNPHFSVGRYQNMAQGEEQRWAIYEVYWHLLARYYYAKRFESTEEQISQVLHLLQLSSRFNKDSGVDWWVDTEAEDKARAAIKQMLPQLSAKQCGYVVAELQGFDGRRGSWENRLSHQRLADQNGGWLKHIRLLMKEWAEEAPFADEQENYLSEVRHMRMLITQVALQLYYLKNRELPQQLGEMVPEYLRAVPVDSFTNKPFEYQHLWGGYALTTRDSTPEDTAIVTGPAAPYLWRRLKEEWQDFHIWLQEFPADPRATTPR